MQCTHCQKKIQMPAPDRLAICADCAEVMAAHLATGGTARGAIMAIKAANRLP